MDERLRRAETLARAERERAPHGFVGGLDLASEGSLTEEVIDASEGSTIGRCPIAHARDVEKAGEAARDGAEALSALGRDGRAELLEGLASLLADSERDLAILECLQTGRSLRDVLGDLDVGVRALRAAAAWTRTTRGAAVDLGGRTVGLSEPAAPPVRSALLPAAEPLAAALRHVARSVAAGSGLLLVAPIEAPLTVLRLGSLARDASLPGGAVNVLTSDGRDVPERVAASPLVDHLDFAGPREVARRVLVGAAKSNLKRVTLDLDDKTPCLIREDAELGPAVDAVWRSALSSPCQIGRAVERVLVHRNLHSEVAARLTSLARATVVGHPLEEHTELGPLCSEARMRRVLKYIELGRREGAKLVAGGERDVEGHHYAGFYVKPTVFLDAPLESRLVREPIEGPVLVIEPFDDDDDAVRRAEVGLGRGGALVFGRDQERALALGRRLGVGQLWVNGPLRLHPDLPHAPAAESGDAILGCESIFTSAERRTIIFHPRR
jgi:acyl-CoA reductase-like NAD-dependent aldehyde dehydrogenase